MLAGGRFNHPAASDTPTREHHVEHRAASGAKAVFNFD
jgi:hypothetical protein